MAAGAPISGRWCRRQGLSRSGRVALLFNAVAQDRGGRAADRSGEVGPGPQALGPLAVGAREEDTVPACADIPVFGHEFEYAFSMLLRYNYRVYPAPGQRQALARAFGCARVVFNDALRAREAAYQAGEPYLTDAQLSARLTTSKATPGRG
jgi:Helix-turn-helix domain